MDARAWRLSGGSAVALLALVALVAWRADALTGGWLLALRVTGLLAVVGLLAAVVLGALAALRPPSAPEVLVHVPGTGPPRTTSRPGRRAVVPLTAVLLLAVVSAAPALAVLVLATSPHGDAVSGPDADPTSSSTEGVSRVPSVSPSSTAAPSPVPSTGPSPVPSTGPSPVPSTGPSTRPPPSPAQLPAEAAAPAGCDRVVVTGDTLWSIARGQLGAGASDADVDARWRALYARNAEAVGPDPDVIRPGMGLRACT